MKISLNSFFSNISTDIKEFCFALNGYYFYKTNYLINHEQPSENKIIVCAHSGFPEKDECLVYKLNTSLEWNVGCFLEPGITLFKIPIIKDKKYDIKFGIINSSKLNRKQVEIDNGKRVERSFFFFNEGSHRFIFHNVELLKEVKAIELSSNQFIVSS